MHGSMTTSARSAAWVLALTTAIACGSRQPKPVEPYSPPEAEVVIPSASAVPSAPAAPAPPPQDDQKSKDCQTLTSAITSNSEMLKSALDKALESKDAKGLGQLATSVDEAGSKVNDLELANRRLKGWASEYRSLMSDLSDALRRAAADRVAKNKDAIKKDLADIRAVDEKEGDLVKRINSFCSD
jgi:hypothetical protein